jgi:hypothetical protein
MADEGRPDRIVEKRSDRLVRALAFEQEDDLRLGQEDGVMLPAPITRTVSTPSRRTRVTSRAIASTRAGSTP